MRVFLNSLTFVYIGDVQFYLTSPRGTKILMADAFTSTGLTWYDQWPFLCVGFWGEDPNGMWTLEVVNQVHQVRPNATSNFILKSWTLELRGSRPHSYPVLPRKYDGGVDAVPPTGPKETLAGAVPGSIHVPAAEPNGEYQQGSCSTRRRLPEQYRRGYHQVQGAALRSGHHAGRHMR